MNGERRSTINSQLLGRRTEAVAHGLATAHPIFAARAEGAKLWDLDGREFVDFSGGIGTMNLGHRHPAVVEAVRKQLECFTHTAAQVVMYEGYVAVAERLNALTPGAFDKQTLLVTTGSEAIENAVKIARAATSRPAIISFADGFHGRTLLALSLTGKVSPYKQNFGPYAPEVYQAPYPNPRRGHDTKSALHALHELFETRVAPNQVAAIVIEPVLGEGGFVAAPFEYLHELRRLTEENGILLIVDEIQTGFGRTGTLFAIEQSGVVPDLLTFGKSVAGGLPIAGVVARKSVMASVQPGALGGTYGGNPLACAAALATLEVFETSDILKRARALGTTLETGLKKIATRFPDDVEGVWGLGPMLAIGFRSTKAHSGKSVAQHVAAAALDFGLITLTAGPGAHAIRILVPLVATDDEIKRGLAALERACERVLNPDKTLTPAS
ncbi:MAG: aspartate aminotransferase family protein [Candidatus Eremiobacteraeota bacterium]|nr:aspartate aminotransferase family protein [Candidatus Eremiobacteraeota bacterium]